MVMSRILGGLDAMDLNGADAVQAARLGFLEWALSRDGDQCARQEARTALALLRPRASYSRAARCFLSYLDEAAAAPAAPPIRRGGRKRVLN